MQTGLPRSVLYLPAFIWADESAASANHLAVLGILAACGHAIEQTRNAREFARLQRLQVSGQGDELPYPMPSVHPGPPQSFMQDFMTVFGDALRGLPAPVFRDPPPQQFPAHAWAPPPMQPPPPVQQQLAQPVPQAQQPAPQAQQLTQPAQPAPPTEAAKPKRKRSKASKQKRDAKKAAKAAEVPVTAAAAPTAVPLHPPGFPAPQDSVPQSAHAPAAAPQSAASQPVAITLAIAPQEAPPAATPAAGSATGTQGVSRESLEQELFVLEEQAKKLRETVNKAKAAEPKE